MKTLKLFKSKEDTQKVADSILSDVREKLLESYQQRILDKMASRYPINLELKYSTEGSTHKSDLYDNKTIANEDIEDQIYSLFVRHQRLLITGEPGAGKTYLLLLLACQLLLEKDQVKHIAIIIDIATWRSRFTSVEEWLLELLPQIGFSKSLAQSLIEENKLLLLFDGLDELIEQERQSLLEAIGEYGKKVEAKYVISSRIAEYAATIDAPVYCQVMVKPLTLEQIKSELTGLATPEARGIIDAIDKDFLFAKAVQIPFYLNATQLLFSPVKSWEEFNFTALILKRRKKEIEEVFIQAAIENMKLDAPVLQRAIKKIFNSRLNFSHRRTRTRFAIPTLSDPPK